MKRKMLSVLLCASISLSLAACGGSAGSSDAGSAAKSAAETDAAESSTAESGSEAAASSAAASSEASSASSEAETASSSAAESEAAESEDASAEASGDIIVPLDQIKASVDGIGDWEAEYSDMAVKGDEKFTWAYIDMGYNDMSTNKLRNTFVKYCELFFPNVTVLEADGELDANRQIQHVENYITQGVDCIILNTVDADACVGAVDTAIENNVRMVVVNSQVNHPELFKRIGYVGSSEFEAGKIQADWMIENIDDTETVKVCYQRGSDGYIQTTGRYSGLFETLDEAGFNYELVSELNSKYMRDTAMTNAEDWITSYGDTIQCIPCCCDEVAMGTLQAYRAAGLIDTVDIIGIDAKQDCLQELKDGNIAATVFQDMLAQAKWAAVSAYDACVNDTVETKSVSVPLHWLTPPMWMNISTEETGNCPARIPVTADRRDRNRYTLKVKIK